MLHERRLWEINFQKSSTSQTEHGLSAWYNPRVNGQLVSAAALLKRCKVESAADADLLRGAASSSLGNINSLEAKEHLRPPATTFWLNLPPFAQETRAKATTGHRQC